jgi:transcriptional regulator with XRE-family HTH domain
MPVDMLVALSNLTRISLAEFLVVSETPVQRSSAESYVTPAERWVPVSWRREALLELFGAEGKLGLSKRDAAKRLGIANCKDLDRWANFDVKVDVSMIIRILNEFHLDATIFFKDDNGSIQVPIWEIKEPEGGVITADKMEEAKVLVDKLEKLKTAEIGKRKSERRAAEYKAENERLRKELELLKRSLNSESATPGRVNEPFTGYRPFGGKVEWAFNRELWQSLPDLFEMTKSEFCSRFGFARMSEYYVVDNARISVLLTICNELRISISHFFIRKGEEVVIHDRGFYQMSPHLFRPIESRMDALNYLFGRWSVFGYSIQDFNQRTGMYYRGLKSASEEERSRVLTLTDICSEFNLSPMLFFDDPNRKDEVTFLNRYEQLILNAIDMRKEIEQLRASNKRLKEQSKNSDNSED